MEHLRGDLRRRQHSHVVEVGQYAHAVRVRAARPRELPEPPLQLSQAGCLAASEEQRCQRVALVHAARRAELVATAGAGGPETPENPISCEDVKSAELSYAERYVL